MYKFHWRDGQISQGPGSDVADAFRKLGYGGGAIAALDRYEVVDPGPDDLPSGDASHLRSGGLPT